jgi:hypothetical protein
MGDLFTPQDLDHARVFFVPVFVEHF